MQPRGWLPEGTVAAAFLILQCTLYSDAISSQSIDITRLCKAETSTHSSAIFFAIMACKIAVIVVSFAMLTLQNQHNFKNFRMPYCPLVINELNIGDGSNSNPGDYVEIRSLCNLKTDLKHISLIVWDFRMVRSIPDWTFTINLCLITSSSELEWRRNLSLSTNSSASVIIFSDRQDG